MDNTDRTRPYLLKLQWADRHLAELEQVIDDFRESEAHRVRADLDLEEGECWVTSAIARTDWRAEEWSLRAGDVLHHLRTALDYAAYQLACLEHDPPKERIEWLICKDAAGFAKGRWKLGGLREDARRFIETHQPYDPITGYPDDPESDPLWRLQQLDIQDKHRFLNIVVYATSFTELVPTLRDLEILAVEEFPTSNVNAGDILARYEVRQTGPNPGIEVEAKGTFEIELGEEGPLIPTLRRMRERVGGLLAFTGGTFF